MGWFQPVGFFCFFCLLGWFLACAVYLLRGLHLPGAGAPDAAEPAPPHGGRRRKRPEAAARAALGGRHRGGEVMMKSFFFVFSIR